MLSSSEKLRRLHKACAFGRLDFVQMLEDCRTGAAQFHDDEDACGITTIHVSGDNRVCYIQAIGGTAEGYKALLVKIEDFARANGCQVVQGTGRPGIAKFNRIDSRGYKPIGTVYEKTL